MQALLDITLSFSSKSSQLEGTSAYFENSVGTEDRKTKRQKGGRYLNEPVVRAARRCLIAGQCRCRNAEVFFLQITGSG